MVAVIEDEFLKEVVGIFEKRAIGATEMAARISLKGYSDFIGL